MPPCHDDDCDEILSGYSVRLHIQHSQGGEGYHQLVLSAHNETLHGNEGCRVKTKTKKKTTRNAAAAAAAAATTVNHNYYEFMRYDVNAMLSNCTPFVRDDKDSVFGQLLRVINDKLTFYCKNNNNTFQEAVNPLHGF